MRSYDTATGNYIAAARAGVVARVLVWVTAKNRTTGAPETMGLWNGEQDQSFTIDGGSRDYYGAGGVLGVDDIRAEVGLQVRYHTITLSAIDTNIANLVRGFDARLAPVEIHRALFNTDTRVLVSEPHRVFKGWVNEISLPTPASGGDADMTVTLASSSRALTRTLSLKKSDESQRLRSDDRFRRYGEVTGQVGVYWGEAGGRPMGDSGGGVSQSTLDLWQRMRG